MLPVRFICVSCVLLGGCEPPPGAYDAKPAAPPIAERPAAPPQADALSKAAGPDGAVEMIRIPAKAGAADPEKYDAGIATTPLTAQYSLQQQLLFDTAIPKAIRLYEETRNRKLASHQEFMSEIIAKSNIRLPPLPPQHRYIYDPERGELMIEKPRAAD